MDPEVQSLIAGSDPYLQLQSDGRVKCTLNGHVMPATLVAVKAFTSGAKFQRLKQRADEEAGFAKYEPFLIQSKNIPEKLYCALTCMLVNKSTDSLRKHMKGKAFLAAKGKFEADELELMEEPDFEESEASQSGEEREDGDAQEGPEEMDFEMEFVANEDAGPGNGAAESVPPQPSKPVKSERRQPTLQPVSRQKGGGKGGGSKSKRQRPAKPGTGAAEVKAAPAAVEKVAPVEASNGGASKAGKRVRANGSRPKKVKRGQ